MHEGKMTVLLLVETDFTYIIKNKYYNLLLKKYIYKEK